MKGTVLALVHGEVLANGFEASITHQKMKAAELAEGLLPLLQKGYQFLLMHGNKPQVGFVLFRSELANHILHEIPLDVCGADTQGATGYMLSQAVTNAVISKKIQRSVISILTQTVVDPKALPEKSKLSAIGPWFDREKAEIYRQTRNWSIIQEPGRGYRRAVPTYPVKEILEIEQIKALVASGNIVIAGGGGGIPVVCNEKGEYEGIEAVVDSEEIVPNIAKKIEANVLIIVVENENKFIRSGLLINEFGHIDSESLKRFIGAESIQSNTVKSTINIAHQFLKQGGEQVVFTTLKDLPMIYQGKRGLRIGSPETSIEELRF
jgi:carbamate kinase